MYRLSESLAREIMSKIRTPEIESSGPNAFLPKNFNGFGVIDPIAAINTDCYYSIECPVPVIYPELPYISTIAGYFLYKKEELKRVEEEWNIAEVFVNPLCTDAEKKINVQEAAIIIASDIDKLTVSEIKTMERLIEKEPLILDCLNFNTKEGR